MPFIPVSPAELGSLSAGFTPPPMGGDSSLPQSFVRNSVSEVTAVRRSVWAPGLFPGAANSAVLMGKLTGLLGSCTLNVPPTETGGTWAGVTVELSIKSGTSDYFPVYLWDIASDGQGQLVDLLIQMRGAGYREFGLDTISGLYAQVIVGANLLATNKVLLFATAVESNQYG